MALSIAHRGYVLLMGEDVLAGSAQELLENWSAVRTETLRLG